MDREQAPNRKAAHNARVRARIIAAAAPVFRDTGAEGARIDDLMAAAGLTRGAFYAHFASKDALFAAVLREAHPLLTQLQNLPDGDMAGLRALFADYLAPAHLPAILRGCTLAALTADAQRAGQAHRAALGAARAAIVDEMQRVAGAAVPRATLDAALSLATGAVQAAAAEVDLARQAATLDAARAAFDRLVPD